MSVPQRSYLGTPATAPGPAGPEMLRHFTRIVREPLAFLAAMRTAYGDVVQFPVPRPPSYLVASPDGAYDLLVRGARTYDKDTIQYRSLSLVTGTGLLTALNDDWRRQRPVVQPAFHRSLAAALLPLVAQETERTLASWRRIERAAPVDVEAAMMQLSLRIVGRALFGTDLSGEAAGLAHATEDALRVVITRSRLPLPVPSGWPTPANRALRRSLRVLDAAVDRLVALPRSARADPPLLLDLLLGAGWSREQVRDQVVTFLVAGHETAASGLTWALWLLAGDEGAQGRCAGDEQFAGACADEALRLFPPAWVISRSVSQPVAIGGYDLPAGALVFVSPYLLHRDARVWPEPDQFRPERFGDGLDAGQRRAYLPFGAGPRLCIGRDFARWEMAAVLHRLCASFRWERLQKSAPRLVTGVTLRPAGGMVLRLQPR